MRKSTKLSLETVDKRFAAKCLKRLDEYINAATPIKVQCYGIDKYNYQCDYIYQTQPNTIFGGHECPKCNDSLQLTNELVDEQIFKAKIANIKRIGDVKNNKKPILWQCMVPNCEYIWTTKFSCIITKISGCPNCANKAPITNNSVDKRIINKNIMRLEDIIDGKTKIKWKCKLSSCLYEWRTKPDCILNSNSGCPKCAGNAPKTNQDIDDLLIKLEKNIVRRENIINMATKINFQCLKCNYEWKTAPQTIINTGCGCPKCNKPGANEKLIFKYLEDNNIKFYFDYDITLVSTQETRHLRFDFYIPELNKAIEYDGVQHFTSSSFKINKNEDEMAQEFADIQERDNYKNTFCINNNISLFRIDGRSYKGFELKQYLKSAILPWLKAP